MMFDRRQSRCIEHVELADGAVFQEPGNVTGAQSIGPRQQLMGKCFQLPIKDWLDAGIDVQQIESIYLSGRVWAIVHRCRAVEHRPLLACQAGVNAWFDPSTGPLADVILPW